MENKRKKLSDRPILFGALCMIMTELCSYGLSVAVAILATPFLRSIGYIDASIDARGQAEQLSGIIYAITPVLAVVCMLAIILALVLTRKSKIEEMKETWSVIWSEQIETQ